MTESLSMSHLQLGSRDLFGQNQYSTIPKPRTSQAQSCDKTTQRYVKVLKSTQSTKVLKSHQLRSIQPPNPS